MGPLFLRADERDNAAIATDRIEAGQTLTIDGDEVVVGTVVPRGHRLCTRRIEPGEALLSWGYPFGYATRVIEPGNYLCNERMQKVLLMRDPDDYPGGVTVNFVDRDTTVEQSIPEEPVLGVNDRIENADGDGLTFAGYRRGKARGWGTRNDVVLIGLTSQSRSLVLEASRVLKPLAGDYDNIEAIVPVAHTEGGGTGAPRNQDLLLRTLAGFAVNPNVGAAVFIDEPDASITNGDVLKQLQLLGSKYKQSTVRFLTAKGDFEESLQEVERVVKPLLPLVNRTVREPAPLSGLKLGLQCGGSDAFSGVTANPLLGAAVQRLLKYGATANLAETDELIGAEEHVLARIAEPDLVRQFITKQNAFKEYAHRHGQTAEGNVSGGNIYRGLYNITLKSLGAGRKKDPRTFLEHVIGYGEQMDEPGYYFMDSPGNDLESISGQVAGGANLILFTTGNGSITNFPFVPTIKIVTTHERFSLMESDMDFNAGLLLSGADREETATELLQVTCAVASGAPSKGEGTGQSQVQIWRDWWLEETAPGKGERGVSAKYSGSPLVPAETDRANPVGTVRFGSTEHPSRRIIELLPTSLCSGQVAEQIAAKLNDRVNRATRDVRWEVVALPHTEGCGVSGGDAEEVFARTMLGYATHPLVSHTVFLEHGCEKTHNDFFRDQLHQQGRSDDDFDWASIQRSGGIAAVTELVSGFVDELISKHTESPADQRGSARPSAIGLATAPDIPNDEQELALATVRDALKNGASVILTEHDPLVSSGALGAAFELAVVAPTLAFGEALKEPGLHVMASARDDWLELATGIGATGAEVIVMFAAQRPRQPHRMIPVIQIGYGSEEGSAPRFDLDLAADSTEAASEAVLSLADAARLGSYTQRTKPRPDVGFQISRGYWGVSL